MMNASVLPFIACLSFMLLTEDQVRQKGIYDPVKWQLVAKLPDANGSVSTGFAGAINGVDNNVLIVAGGANFPDKLPWEGGRKHYADEVHILHRNGDTFLWDKNNALKLPGPVAYCGNTSTPAGIVYAGGENDKGLSDKAYLLKWDTGNDKLAVKRLPNLPVAVTNIALTSINNVVYAVGGDGAVNSVSLFCCMDLNNQLAGWQILPALPLPLANTVAITQHGPKGNYVYVIGGRSKMPSGISTLHSTVFRYDLSKGVWENCAQIADGKKVTNFSAGAGVAFGKHSILIIGGDNGMVFHKIETYLARIKKAISPTEKDKLIKEKNELNINHKGFYKGVLLYNTLENTWTKIGELPFAAHVTTTAVKWGDDVVISNGEVKPGIRTPDVMLGRILITEK
jgi:N-acetylneuraminate epimerase